MLNISDHAVSRAIQRGLPIEAINYILDHGKVFHKSGAIIYFLRKRDIPVNDQRYEQISRPEGTALVISKDRRTIITVWRNRNNGLKNIKRKPRYLKKLESYCA